MEQRAEELLDTYGIYASMTRGVSMWPLFKTHRDRVYIVKPEGDLASMDVALYPDGHGSYIMHRVIRVCEGEYLIRGDNTFHIEHVPKSRVIGVLSEFDRKDKHYTVSYPPYRFYARVWNALYPLRALIHGIAYVIRGVGRRMLRLFKRRENAKSSSEE